MADSEPASARPIILMVDHDHSEADLLAAAMMSLLIPLAVEAAQTGGHAMNRLVREPSTMSLPVAMVLINDHLPDMRGSVLASVLATGRVYAAPRVVLMAGGPYCIQVGPWEAWLEKPRSWSGWEGLARQLQQRLLATGGGSPPGLAGDDHHS